MPTDPKPEMGVPDTPAFIEEQSAEVWERVCQHLQCMGLLAKVDGFLLQRYCRMFVRWHRAERFIEEYGEKYPIKDADENVKCFQQFPEVAIARTLSEAMRKIEAEFGMTPSSRSSIKTDTPIPQTNKTRFFK